jgi:tetratricopeptide (TPR) repeat protein
MACGSQNHAQLPKLIFSHCWRHLEASQPGVGILQGTGIPHSTHDNLPHVVLLVCCGVVDTRKKLLLWFAATVSIVLLFFMFASNNPRAHQQRRSGGGGDGGSGSDDVLVGSGTSGQCQLDPDSDLFPANSKFEVTKTSPAYDVMTEIACWIPGCTRRNNRLAFAKCASAKATEWNLVGVHAAERALSGETEKPALYYKNFFADAKRAFAQAVELDADCAIAAFNLGLIEAKLKEYDAAQRHFQMALSLFEQTGSDSEQALVQLWMGLSREVKDGRVTPAAVEHYDRVRSLDLDVERQWWGIATTSSGRSELFNHGTYQAPTALFDMGLYKWFSPVSIGNFALLDPGTQDTFIENRYAVLRRVLPPYVLAALAGCYRNFISDNVFQFGDTQSQRFVAYNERCTRFIHYQLVDFVRRVIAHNAKPTYTYFGGYRGGSELKPHNDREQCEWTISLQVEQNPADKPWLLSLGKRPAFDRDPRKRTIPSDKIPPEDEIVDADLYAGDALLFMGRQLVHFRRGKLPDGHTTNQAFLHYVPADFKGKLG